MAVDHLIELVSYFALVITKLNFKLYERFYEIYFLELLPRHSDFLHAGISAR